ncbi:MAG TPA: hypothetical protein H9902_06145 [Candidatus Stackebrandtia faecavium]|nr:hypothetical protein [Candidatus Stackebrandtia faecavium]
MHGLAADAKPGVLITGAMIAAAGLSGMAAGPVAAGLALAYLCWALRAWRRMRARQQQTQHEHEARHAISLAAADLHSGAACAPVLNKVTAVLAPDASRRGRVTRERVEAIRDVAERTGAPAARLIELLADELRAQTRGRAAVIAQTAGSLASAKLLAALPIVGIALGESIGAQPLAFLLYTPIGAACAAATVALQALGLKWAERIESRAYDEWGWGG